MGIGNAATDMTARMPSGTAQADGSMKVEATFDVEHVASTVVYMSNLPLDTNVQFVHQEQDVPVIGAFPKCLLEPGGRLWMLGSYRL